MKANTASAISAAESLDAKAEELARLEAEKVRLKAEKARRIFLILQVLRIAYYVHTIVGPCILYNYNLFGYVAYFKFCMRH